MTPDEQYNIASSLRELAFSVHENARAKGFWDAERNFGECIALIHSELSEALESYRRMGDFREVDHHVPEYPNVAVELADAIIRILDLAQAHGLPIASALLDKHQYNEGRPRKHGKAF